MQAAIGLRSMLVRSAGYDPFSGNDTLTQLSLGVEYLVTRSGPLVFAAGIGGDYGQNSSRARSASTQLAVGRVSLIAEGRYQPWERGYGFVRFAPGWLGIAATVPTPRRPPRERWTTGSACCRPTPARAAARLSPPRIRLPPGSPWRAAIPGLAATTDVRPRRGGPRSGRSSPHWTSARSIPAAFSSASRWRSRTDPGFTPCVVAENAGAVSARPTSAIVRAGTVVRAVARARPTGAEAQTLHLRRSTGLSARRAGYGSNHASRRLLGARRTRGYGVGIDSSDSWD